MGILAQGACTGNGQAVEDTTNLAARLQQNTPPGVILVSQTTSRLVQEQVYLAAKKY
jgi:class 3 adenylate cyclase